MKPVRSLLVRLAGGLVLIAIAATILWPPLAAKREERRVRAMLLTVQEALQNYHVDEEIYPRNPMPGAELIAFLKEEGFLEEPPENPWTRGAYEVGGEDRLRYRTDALAETYELTVSRPESDEVQFRLDSTENQSLE